jgi:hypothetical protein
MLTAKISKFHTHVDDFDSGHLEAPPDNRFAWALVAARSHARARFCRI